MNAQQVAAIALKLVAIWLLIELVLSLPSILLLLSSIEQYRQEAVPTGAYVAIVGAYFGIGVLAVFLIDKAATSVLERTRTDSEESASDEFQKVLFQLAGLYFIVDAIASLPRSLGFIAKVAEVSVPDLLWPVGLVFQLAIGSWLVGNSSFWLSLFHRLRGRA